MYSHILATVCLVEVSVSAAAGIFSFTIAPGELIKDAPGEGAGDALPYISLPM